MILEISSYENSVIKHTRQLLIRKYREKFNEYMIEGVRITKDALLYNQKIVYILFCESIYNTAGGKELLDDLMNRNIKIYKISDKIFKELSDTENTQGIIAVLSYNEYDLKEILNKNDGLYVVLDRIQDPGNLGTIIRSADASGADAVILSKGCVDLYNLKTIRSTMGSIFHLPIVKMGETLEIVKQLKQEAVQIISTSLDTNKYHYDVEYRKSTAFVIGNEANGVSEEVLKEADALVKIPMIGKAESLNAAVAAAIVMYEAVRQRHSNKI
ncbi:23S rRNA (guanosine(2251)-2'-O)-methyltransferase RlmB [Lutibacter sp. B2]|nr:23S rRNA (guanosine(2251)-2'-O)-methyltransferase RlmB [Lutibacter sp. B2]